MAIAAQAKNGHSRDIVTRFLQADPSQRLGNLADGMDEARNHPYFADIDWNALAHKRMPVSTFGTASAPFKQCSSLRCVCTNISHIFRTS